MHQITNTFYLDLSTGYVLPTAIFIVYQVTSYFYQLAASCDNFAESKYLAFFILY